jgi:hypothetical protein
VRINSAYIVRDVFGKMILIPYKKTKIGNHPIYLNDTGRLIVQMLEESVSEKELCLRVAQTYNLQSESDEYGQIENFVANLVNMDVVVQD